MLINLVPDFLAVLEAPDREAAYRAYFERHRPLLAAYWDNYVVEPEGPVLTVTSRPLRWKNPPSRPT